MICRNKKVELYADCIIDLIKRHYSKLELDSRNTESVTNQETLQRQYSWRNRIYQLLEGRDGNVVATTKIGIMVRGEDASCVYYPSELEKYCQLDKSFERHLLLLP